MKKRIEKTIRKCDICARTKHDRHKFYELLKSLSTSNRAWKSIALNFIIKLSKFKKRVIKTIYDFILIIVNRLIKYNYFLSYKKTSIAKDLIYTFFKTIIANHELLNKIISNRNKLFTSKFWKSLMNQLKIHHKLLTIYHFQTNEQTKRMNQTLKQYFRCYINYKQNNWVQLLSITQLTFNSATTEVFNVSSFFANYEFELKTFKKSRKFTKIIQKVTIQIEQLTLLHKELQKNIQFLIKRFALYVNKKRNKNFILKEKDKIYLLRRNIKTKKSSNKLNYIKLKSFRILKTKRSVNFKLDLSIFMRIYSIFYISFLKSADSNTLIQTESSEIDSENQNVEYEVENILNQQKIQDQFHYLIKWKDYEHIENIWKSEKNLTNCQKLLRQFQLRNSISRNLKKSEIARKIRRKATRQ